MANEHHDQLLNAMTDAINLDNAIRGDLRERMKSFYWPWQRIFLILAVFQSLLGLIIAGKGGFTGDGAIDLSEAIAAGVLIAGGGLTGWVAYGPGGSPKDSTEPRDLPPIGAKDDDEED
ncbi:MAG: hypothetical protein R3301_15115 [Saprospiraceae bacterium]|nr:hypothetical protein [Saprospiraceae bacterium]